MTYKICQIEYDVHISEHQRFIERECDLTKGVPVFYVDKINRGDKVIHELNCHRITFL